MFLQQNYGLKTNQRIRRLNPVFHSLEKVGRAFIVGKNCFPFFDISLKLAKQEPPPTSREHTNKKNCSQIFLPDFHRYTMLLP